MRGYNFKEGSGANSLFYRFLTTPSKRIFTNPKVPNDVNELKLSNKLPDVGSDVHAIGHPGSLSWTYTKGYVSQIRNNYKWNYENTQHEASIIQTQTPISPGNSGGPLISSEGELLGVNSFKAQGENLNFAVNSLEVINFLKNIKNVGKKEAKKKENKKIDKVVKKIDSDNDGTPDTFYYDDDGDGIIDTVIKDKNQNGKLFLPFLKDIHLPMRKWESWPRHQLLIVLPIL